jgi:predicted AlkP superfamily phosphohydrolase/phosphomutase
MSPKKAVTMWMSIAVLVIFLVLGIIGVDKSRTNTNTYGADWLPPGSTIIEKRGNWYIFEMDGKKFLFSHSVYNGYITQIVEPPKCEDNH